MITHTTDVESRVRGGGTQYRAVCSCKWTSTWQPGRDETMARNAVNDHEARQLKEAIAGGVVITPETLTDEMIREFQRMDLCATCNCGLLAAEHHNDLLDGPHRFNRMPKDWFITALYEFDYPSARIEAKQRICAAINARAGAKP